MVDISPDTSIVEARKYFSKVLLEYLNSGFNYHNFWQSKENGLLKIEKTKTLISDRYFSSGERNSAKPSQSFDDFQDKKVIEIQNLLKEIDLDIDIHYDRLFQDNKINFIIEQYKFYKNAPFNYSFYFLEPLKTDKRELILQIENEIKNRVWERDNEERQINIKAKIETKISNFKGTIDEIKQKDVIRSITSKYRESKFCYDLRTDRFHSLNEHLFKYKIDLTKKVCSWEDFRHYLCINIVTITFEQIANEIIEDAELLRLLGYFDEKDNSSISKIEFPFQPKLIGKGTLLGLFVKCLKEGEFKHLPPLKEKDFEEIVKLYDLTAKNVFQNFSANSDKNPFKNHKNLQIIKEILQNLENYPKALYYLENEKHK